MSRKRKKSRLPGFKLEIVEAPDKDKPWTQAARDALYNHLLVEGTERHSYIRFCLAHPGRSLKSCRRQWQIILYALEEATLVGKYRPGPKRQWRGGIKTASCAEKEIALKHAEDHVLPKFTAIILQRTVDQVLAIQEGKRIVPSGPVALLL